MLALEVCGNPNLLFSSKSTTLHLQLELLAVVAGAARQK